MKPTRFLRLSDLLLALALLGAIAPSAGARQPQPPRQDAPGGGTQAPIERLGPNLLRVGTVRVDTGKKEISAQGTFTPATALEFIAVARKGFKAYESAIELDTTAIDFNLALILIGLDPSRARVPEAHFDTIPPKGDPVEIWVEWNEGANRRRVRAEQLIYNEITKQVLSEGPWVYTGSAFAVNRNAYLAEREGTLIGFVHTPAPVIESPRPLVEGAYGNNILNPALEIEPGTSVTLTVRALPLGK
jgi:hypothetical protein